MDEYYNKYLNNLEDRLEKICNKLNNFCCPNCGGSYKSGVCVFCYAKNTEVIETETQFNNLINQIESVIESTSIIKKHIVLDIIYLNRDFTQTAKNFIIKTNYESIFKNNLSMVENKVKNNQQLDNNELKLLSLNLSHIDDSTKLIQYCSILLKSYVESDEAKNLLKSNLFYITETFVTELSKTFVENPSCTVLNCENDEILGRAFDNNINLYRSAVELLNSNNYFEGFIIMFHEIAHLYQYKTDTIDKNVSLFGNKRIKEKTIRSELPDFYTENYELSCYENEANIIACDYVCEFLDRMNLNCDRNPIFAFREHEFKTALSNKRSYNGKIVELDDVFLEVLNKKPDILNSFPQLSLEYINKDGKFVEKNYDEISADYQNYLKNPCLINGSSIEIEYLYAYLKEKKLKEQEFETKEKGIN